MPTPTTPTWTLEPHPAPHRFAFTIVHDADSAYSLRLRPLFECFAELGMRITVTVFPFWAAWSDEGRIWEEWRRTDPMRAPVAVPLEDDAELDFYRELAAAGHEIAMHTPSETSSVREEVPRAFEFFESAFGFRPRMYVEHSPGNNLDAQQREGADPTSPYYNTDLLNDSGCWIWVLDEVQGGRPRDRESTDLRKEPAGPFGSLGLPLYGIARGFLRNGFGNANGDAFLEQYTNSAIDRLATDRGLALLYTHCNYGWVDPDTRRVREPIRERLAYIAGKPGWFVPGSDILDRWAAVRQVHLVEGEGWVKLVNTGPTDLDALVIRPHRDATLVESGQALAPAEDGSVVIDRLAPFQTRTFLSQET